MNNSKETTLCLVVPCYNEELALPHTGKVLSEKLASLKSIGKISDKSCVYFVDDGSKDSTWQVIEQLHNNDSSLCGIKLSRNEGHQNALLCGLLTVRDKCDVSISMDADLQHDIDAIDDMLEKFHNGAEIVYGVRKARTSDGLVKKITGNSFYKLMEVLADKKDSIIYNHADFRLMGSRALDALSEFKEVNIFLRGLVPLIGFKTDIVYFDQHTRIAGESKYPLKKMLAFAFQGITSLSVKPLHLMVMFGGIIFLVSIGMLIYFIIEYFMGKNVPGYSTIVVSIWAIGGLLQLSVGICGEYIGKIYLETKGRPRFIIEKIVSC